MSPQHTKQKVLVHIYCFSRNIFIRVLFILLLILSFLVLRYFQHIDSETVKIFKLKEPNKPQLVKAFGKLPMRFEANQGQTDEQVKFISRGDGYTLFLTSNGAVLSLRTPEAGDRKPDKENTIDSGFPLKPQSKIRNPKSNVVHIQLVGSNPSPQIKGQDELVGKSNYFSGKNRADWHTDIPNYAKVKYQGIYPGIDLIYYGNRGQLEYDFVVAPGADPDDIVLGLEGTDDASVDDEGNLVLPTTKGELTLKSPVIYQEIDGEKRSISGHYALADANHVCFEIGAYETNRPLIIDPVLSYSTYLGGSYSEHGIGIGVDNGGNIYIMGSTNSTDFPLVNPFQDDTCGVNSLFVTKMDPTGSTLLYSTYFGGSSNEGANDFAVDVNGNAYLTGFTWSNDFPVINAFQSSKPDLGGYSFVTKFNSNGSLVYSTYLGGNGGQWGSGIAVDGAGNAYVTGITAALDFPIVNAFQAVIDTTLSRAESYITKFSPEGSIVYSTFLGGNDKEYESAIAVDAAGNAYVAGKTMSDNFPVVNGFQTSRAGDWDLFITKLNATGSGLVYSTYLGGSKSESGNYRDDRLNIAVDAEGYAYITGYTASSDFPTVNAFQDALIKSYMSDPFVSKLSADGSKLIYSTYLGGSDFDESQGIAVDNAGCAYVVGYTNSPDFPTENSVLDSPMGEYDIFITKFSADGSNLLFSTYFGGIDDDEANEIFIDNHDNVFITGETWSKDFPVVDPLQSSRSGPCDAFIIKIEDEDTLCYEGKIWQVVKFPGQFSTNKEENEVYFVRVVDGKTIRVEAEIVDVTEDTISVRVPEGLIGEVDETNKALTRKNVLKPPDPSEGSEIIRVEITVTRSGEAPITKIYCFRLIFPRYLIYDEVVIGGAPIFTPRPPPFTQQILVQSRLNFAQDVQPFIFVGRSTDGTAGLRVMNTRPFPTPLRLEAIIIRPDGRIINPDPPINVGLTNEGFQFPVSMDGLYLIIVRHKADLIFNRGPFQIHLSGNVGVPRKEVNDVPEHPRATRLDILFNHPAPRPQTLVGEDSATAQTGLFKFANPVTVNTYAIAVLIPPVPQGYRSGIDAIVRVADPAPLGFLSTNTNGAPVIDITTPTARAPAGRTFNVTPFLRGVIDFTQIPDPASVEEDTTYLGGTVCAVIGKKDNVTLTLPELGVTSLILDMGSGYEIVDGQDNDFKIHSPSGKYSVAVSNTPFSIDFKTIPGIAEGDEEFDLSGTTLSSARYVRIMASPEVTLDAVQALNYFTDAVRNNFPVADVDRATITMRRAKAPETLFDPWLELIAPNGSLMGRKRSSFGDLTSTILSDAALINEELVQIGYYRFLGRGYDLTPDEEAFGSFCVRLESGGDYDPVDILVSDQDESSTLAQKRGTINNRRQRDSYIFMAIPGQSIKIIVNGASNSGLFNPVIELYDPEDFLIAANDDYPGRERNAVLNIPQLPTTSFFSGASLPLSYPSTYRIVVSAIDGTGETTQFNETTAYTRDVVGGDYELKVFTGTLIGGDTNPTVNNITPNSAFQGTTDLEVTIDGDRFVDGAAVAFSGTGITVKNITFNNTKQLKATIDITATAQTGKHNVIVTNPDGQSGTGTGLFSVTPASQSNVILTWDAPASGQGLASPTNLVAQIGGGQMSGSDSAALKRNFSQTIEELSVDVPQTKTIQKGANQEFLIDPIEELMNGVPVTRSLIEGETHMFFITVPEDATTLTVKTENSMGDPDLFLRFNAQPDLYYYIFDFSSENFGPEEELITVNQSTTPPLQAGDWYVAVWAWEATTYTLTATHDGNGGAQLLNYYIYRSTTANARNSGALVGIVGANTTTYTDVVPNLGSFFYQVTAVYDQGESEPSNEAMVLVTRVEDGQFTSLPVEFAFGQNYPNPFNPTTRIRFDVPVNSHVNITIFNLVGQKVINLVNRSFKPGKHEIEWNGRDEQGMVVVSGVYIYLIQAGSFTQSRKMVFMR